MDFVLSTDVSKVRTKRQVKLIFNDKCVKNTKLQTHLAVFFIQMCLE